MTVHECCPEPAPQAVKLGAGWQCYLETVGQADTGADLNFLVGFSGPDVARESH